MDVDVQFATVGRASFHELKPEEVKPVGQLRNPGLFAIDRQPVDAANSIRVFGGWTLQIQMGPFQV